LLIFNSSTSWVERSSYAHGSGLQPADTSSSQRCLHIGDTARELLGELRGAFGGLRAGGVHWGICLHRVEFVPSAFCEWPPVNEQREDKASGPNKSKLQQMDKMEEKVEGWKKGHPGPWHVCQCNNSTKDMSIFITNKKLKGSLRP